MRQPSRSKRIPKVSETVLTPTFRHTTRRPKYIPTACLQGLLTLTQVLCCFSLFEPFEPKLVILWVFLWYLWPLWLQQSFFPSSVRFPKLYFHSIHKNICKLGCCNLTYFTVFIGYIYNFVDFFLESWMKEKKNSVMDT